MKPTEDPSPGGGASKVKVSKVDTAPNPTPRPPPHAEVLAAQTTDILSVFLVFRFINALCVRTFFQPDEYFQALDPAWSIAFGGQSGAWLTWVNMPQLEDFSPYSQPAYTVHRNGNISCARRCIQHCLGQRTWSQIR